MASKAVSRLPFLLPGMLCLAAGVLTGLTRAGIAMPEIVSEHAGVHSLLFISGFFGTVIGLERAVASQRRWPYLAPALSGLGGALLLFGDSLTSAAILFTLAALCFVAASILVYVRQPALHSAMLLIAAILWLAGNLGWLVSGNSWSVIPYGLSFLVLTIAGERLELTRFLPPRKFSRPLFMLITLTVIGGTLLSSNSAFTDNAWLGLSYAALSLWLINFDIARKTVRQSGITRFVAICLLSGYVWLLVGGLLLSGSINLGPLQRDAGIHAVALGFIFAMVIGHAPIIFPAVMRVAIPFSPLFYLPLILIETGVGLRFWAVLLTDPALRAFGALSNALAILLFIVTLIGQVTRGIQARRSPASTSL